MVISGYRIVDGKRVATKKQRRRERDPDYVSKATLAAQRKRRETATTTAYQKQQEAPKVAEPEKKVTTLPVIEAKPKGPSRAELDAEQRRREEAGEAEQETQRQAEQRRVIELNKAEEEADRRRMDEGLTYAEVKATGGFRTDEDVRIAMGTVPIFGGPGGAAVNTKSIGLAKNVVSKIFSKKALAFYGAWAGSVFLGRWGQAEAAEPITIPLRDALRQAQETGDWRIYNEYLAAAEEITNPSVWREIALWSPLAAIPGIQNKMEGVAKGVQLLKDIADKEKERQLTGESEDDKWARIYADQKQRREQQRIEDKEYWEDVRDKAEEARRDNRRDDEKYWNDIYQKKIDDDAAKRKEEEDYWKGKAEERKEEEAGEKAEELEEMLWKALYYDLIRDGKYEEAAALLQSKVKGG